MRTREHATRKHGIKPDRYFLIRYQADGKRKEEGLGWASEGWTAEKAALKLAELKQAAKTGQGETRLSGKREAKRKFEQAAWAQQQEEERKAVTYSIYFSRHYLPEQTKKESTLKPERILHEKWILPAIVQVPVAKLEEQHIRKIIQSMSSAGKSARTVQYALAAVRMVVGHAVKNGYYSGLNPVTQLARQERPKVENRRLRFFSHAEAEKLLKLLKERSRNVHDMTLLSLHCGLRAGEIFGLEWRRVDLVHRQVVLTETKSGKDRVVPMTGAVHAMFEERARSGGDALVFPDGGRRKSMSKTFGRVVDELGLNAGVSDAKSRLVFHSCRHTCASWLVQPLITVKEILGHSTIALTERYSHLAPDGTQAALRVMMEQAAGFTAGTA
ncbi:tyrosine-type recombinase/integrase [Candidatus Electronema sp. PJ]|uniref:tyrosine-type recombinase/integrase n=1 Tax=Candidatus Electronema sp. PJ TaxID=3401572 RepID=UPI003AA9C3DC